MNDKKWISNLMEKYEWPEPSVKLKNRILSQAIPYQTQQKNSYLSIFQDFFSYGWQPVGALAIALMLGVFVGSFVLSGATHSVQASIYTDSYYGFAESIVGQYNSKGD